MAEESDFWAYVAARWPALVRSLVERGAPPAEAHELAAEALSRCRRPWAAVSREGDVEALVQDELAAAWRRHRPAGGPPSSGSEDDVTILAPPSPEDLRGHDRRRRAKAAKRAAAVLVPLALVGAGLTWWSTRDAPEPDDDELPAAVAQRVENPLPTAWYAGDLLHLQHVALRVGGLVDVTALGTGAVYGDAKGRVVHVGDDGSRLVLGHKDPDVPVAATDETGLATWIDTAGGARRLVVYEAARGNRVAELDVDASTSVIAVDGRAVFFRDAQGTHAWLPDGPTVVPVTPADLVDVRSRIRAFQLESDRIQVVQSFFDVSYSLPGYGAVLAPDGDTVATRLDRSGYGRLALYDARSGEALPTGLEGSEVALAVSLGRRQSVTYVVAEAADMSTTGPFLRGFTGGDLVIRQCELAQPECVDVVELPDATEVPVLAR